jgi:uncharacterized membrane protein
LPSRKTMGFDLSVVSVLIILPFLSIIIVVYFPFCVNFILAEKYFSSLSLNI